LKKKIPNNIPLIPNIIQGNHEKFKQIHYFIPKA